MQKSPLRMNEESNIEGFPNYHVTRCGQIKNLLTGAYRKIPLCKGGYARILFSIPGEKMKGFLVHRLVALAYIPRVEGKNDVNHKDCNKANNNVENLEWCTKSENALHAIKNNRWYTMVGRQCWKARLTDDNVREIRKNSHLGLTKLAEMFNIDKGSICRILKNQSWKHVKI